MVATLRRAAPAGKYPSTAALRAILAELALINQFSVADVLSERPGLCCIVEHLPTRRVRAASSAQLANCRRRGQRVVYYGTMAKGYVVASCVAPRAADRWPTCRNGKSFTPVTLHRWVGQIPLGKVCAHTCHTPACIRFSCMAVTTNAENLRQKPAATQIRALMRAGAAHAAHAPALSLMAHQSPATGPQRTSRASQAPAAALSASPALQRCLAALSAAPTSERTPQRTSPRLKPPAGT